MPPTEAQDRIYDRIMESMAGEPDPELEPKDENGMFTCVDCGIQFSLDQLGPVYATIVRRIIRKVPSYIPRRCRHHATHAIIAAMNSVEEDLDVAY